MIYLMFVGGVLDDNGNWLYDHPGFSSTDHHSAIVAELSGLILSALFSVSDVIPLACDVV